MHLRSSIVALPATFPLLSSHVTTVPFSSGEAVTVRVEVWQLPSLPIAFAEKGPHTNDMSPPSVEWLSTFKVSGHAFEMIIHTD